MSAAKALIQGFVSRLLPGAFIDDRDDAKPVRMKRYGEVSVSEFDTNLYGYCEEGSMTVSTTPTPGTGFTWPQALVFNDTVSGSIYIQNNESVANPNAKSLYMGWIKMIPTATPTGVAVFNYAVSLDTVARTYTTDNTTAITSVSPNGLTISSITPTIKFQNSNAISTMSASSANRRIVGRGTLGGLGVIGDEMIISFGRGNIAGHPGLTAAESAGLSKRVSNCSPVVIAPGQNLTIYLWGTTMTQNITPEIELVMWAR